MGIYTAIATKAVRKKRKQKEYAVKIQIKFFEDIKFFSFKIPADNKKEALGLAELYVKTNFEAKAISAHHNKGLNYKK